MQSHQYPYIFYLVQFQLMFYQFGATANYLPRWVAQWLLFVTYILSTNGNAPSFELLIKFYCDVNLKEYISFVVFNLYNIMYDLMMIQETRKICFYYSYLLNIISYYLAVKEHPCSGVMKKQLDLVKNLLSSNCIFQMLDCHLSKNKKLIILECK